MEINDIRGTALITGGSSGIGYEIGRELASRRYNLVLVSNQEEALKKACDEFQMKYKISAWPVFMDLAESGAAQKLYGLCRSEHPAIDILVNNAGIFFFGEVVETSPEKMQEMISLHVSVTTMLCVLFGKGMKTRRHGYILNISSLAAFMPYPGIACYNATKNFLKSFSQSLGIEMIDYNVHVTCICPGAISTNLYNLSENNRKKALNTGIMMPAEKLAKKAVRALFRGKSIFIPGFINHIFLVFIKLTPQKIILMIRRNSRFLPPEK